MLIHSKEARLFIISFWIFIIYFDKIFTYLTMLTDFIVIAFTLMNTVVSLIFKDINFRG